MRYKEDVLEKFIGKVSDYKMMEKLLISTKMTAMYDLADGDFEYFNALITDYKIK